MVEIRLLLAFFAIFVRSQNAIAKSTQSESESRTKFAPSLQDDQFKRIHGAQTGGGKNIFGLTIYYGSCPVDSHRKVQRIDRFHICNTGGHFACDEACESRFNDDDEEVLGGRCLGPGGSSYGVAYGSNGGYTGYGGSCICFYCKGVGINGTQCTETVEEQTLKEDSVDQPLNIYTEYDDDDVIRTSTGKGRSGLYAGNQAGIGYGPISGFGHHSKGNSQSQRSTRCNDKCTLMFVNVKKGICKRSHSYKFECVCKTCGEPERYRPFNNIPGTVDCFEINPDRVMNTFNTKLPVAGPVHLRICGPPSRNQEQERDLKPNACRDACLTQYTHIPVEDGYCVSGRRLPAPNSPVVEELDLELVFDASCICRLCQYPRCFYDTWNDWSSCSSRCNGGTRRRQRNLMVGDRNDCTDLINFRPCNEFPCPSDCVVAPWGGWTRCHGYCGTGSETRERQVLVPPLYGGKCGIYEFVQRRSCDTGTHCESRSYYDPQPKNNHPHGSI